MKTNALLFIIIAISIVIGVFWYLSSNGQDALLSASGGGNAAQTQFQALANELQPITFDTSIFSDAAFNSLVDLSTPVTPEPSGRPDPFMPFTAAAAPAVAATTSVSHPG